MRNEFLSNEILISIIVPVYNVEKYLDRCVQSVIHQSVGDWELILIDDGSPDRCPQMCDDYAKQDKRIKVVHQENGGLSNARNAGIAMADGKYLLFLDSDDRLVEDALNHLTMLPLADMDLCFVDHMESYGDKESYNKAFNRDFINFKQDDVYDKYKLELAIVDLYRDKGCTASIGAACSAVYRTEFLKENEILFPWDTALLEDKSFLLKCISFTDKIFYKSAAFINYFMNIGSLSTMSYDGKTDYVIKIFDRLRAYVKHIPKERMQTDSSKLFDYVILLTFLWRIADSSDQKLITEGHKYCKALAVGIQKKNCKEFSLPGIAIIYLSSKGRFGVIELLMRGWKRLKKIRKVRW
jgi:glycosyltransferase involved in cell wall biosynthesis